MKDEFKLISKINVKKRFHQPFRSCGEREAGEIFFCEQLYPILHRYAITYLVIWINLSPSIATLYQKTLGQNIYRG